MALQKHPLPNGYALPSIHAWPPFFTEQPNPTTHANQTSQWAQLILSYARHANLFTLRQDDLDWIPIFTNPRIKRALKPAYIERIIAHLVTQNSAIYHPPKQTRSVLLYWRHPEEWAELLHQWVTKTGQLNTILTFFEIASPPIPSPLEGIPHSILRSAVAHLAKSGRAQVLDAGTDGAGARFFAGSSVSSGS